jgi:predicted nucleic acid-binding protein
MALEGSASEVRIFFDSSILVGGYIELDETGSCQAILDAVAEDRVRNVHTAWHCCLEFYSVTTRLPQELRLSPEAALTLVEEEIFARFTIHQLPAEDHLPFFRGICAERIAGGRVYDAQIAEVARTAQAALVVTDNRRHFLTALRHGIQVLTAVELVKKLELA